MAPVRHRRRPRLSGRTAWVVAGAVALAGLGVAGASVATERSEAETGAVALDDRLAAERTAADDRADRSVRESATPTPEPGASTADPSPTATTPAPTRTTTRPATPKAAPKKTTAKATPKKTPTKSAGTPKAAWVNPMPGAAVTSCYGPRWGTLHAGIDLALPAGTPIRAAAAGTVVKAGDVGDGYGISVFVDHGNGYLTHYAHLSVASVAVGAKVTAGQRIGSEGSTGDSTGPHLHFEVHQGGMWNQIDPGPFMRERGVDLGC
ncbi:peptidoglycan DD-metalloendopeptidase family protein [Micromonospora sp. NPDC000207]|uniref:M23 family metallopeptidase n=1 Tax=Micromonospora sp. NPDC000207 TaxID=3154246 RepID=UPI00332857F7